MLYYPQNNAYEYSKNNFRRLCFMQLNQSILDSQEIWRYTHSFTHSFGRKHYLIKTSKPCQKEEISASVPPILLDLVNRKILFLTFQKQELPLLPSILRRALLKEYSQEDLSELHEFTFMLFLLPNSTIQTIKVGISLHSILSSRTGNFSVFYDSTVTSSIKSSRTYFDIQPGDVLILKSYKGTYGNYLYLFVGDNLAINYDFSFFAYRLTTINKAPYLEINCEKTDFENTTYFIHLEDQIVKTRKELLA